MLLTESIKRGKQQIKLFLKYNLSVVAHEMKTTQMVELKLENQRTMNTLHKSSEGILSSEEIK